MEQEKRVELGLQVTPNRRKNLLPQNRVRMKMTTSKGVEGLINIRNSNLVAWTIRKVTQMMGTGQRSFRGETKKTLRRESKRAFIT